MAFLGIELGSTRIKAVVIDEAHAVLAASTYGWENQMIDGHWSYCLEEVWQGLQHCIANLSVPLQNITAMGVSAMMHGYLVFDSTGKQLVPFRTWRNTNAAEAAQELSMMFDFRLPRRWSTSHLYQAILNQESHVANIAFMTTLAGYVHWKLTGEQVFGIGDASGMFPIDNTTHDYDNTMLCKFDGLGKLHCGLREILPKVLIAGQPAGTLTKAGAALLDPSGGLQPGITLCPPEGDAGTGMVATNSVTPHSGNVSAGTSIFAMVVLEHALPHALDAIDIVTTPAGKPVAMVHCNNCTSDIDAWASLLMQFAGLLGASVEKPELYDKLYAAALDGKNNCGSMLSYNFFSGEPIAGVSEGHPLLMRSTNSDFTPQNLMRSLVFSAVASLRLGLDILAHEQVKLARVMGHGGFFKSPGAAQLMAAALAAPVSVMAQAGEGGAWGIALLAAFMAQKKPNETLESFLEHRVFAGQEILTIAPNETDRQSFDAYFEGWKQGLALFH